MSTTIQFIVDVEIENDDIDESNVDISNIDLDGIPEDTEFSWASRRVE